MVADEVVGDYIPFDPVGVDRLPDRFAQFAAGLTATERDRGPRLAERAFERFAVAPDADVIELVVSHNFTIGGFVCHALGAPMWRWMTLNQANCGITVIRYRADVPPALECFNDTGHL
jgi:probable phosphoglycerate mutase